MYLKEAIWEEAEYVIPCFSMFVFLDKLWQDLHVKSTSSECTLMWQKAMVEILLLSPKAENVLMYYRKGKREKYHIQIELNCLQCVFSQFIWRSSSKASVVFWRSQQIVDQVILNGAITRRCLSLFMYSSWRKNKKLETEYESSKERKLFQYVACPDLPTVTDMAANFECTTQYSAESCRRIPIAIKICHYVFKMFWLYLKMLSR